MSPSRTAASNSSSAPLLGRVPETFSWKMRVQPARGPWSSLVSRCWPAAETRAYPKVCYMVQEV
jgi:hypothetical protein